MTSIHRRTLLCAALAGLAGAAHARQTGGFVCPPCGCAMDGAVFPDPGLCLACGMRLVPASPAPVEPPALAPGAGMFWAAGGPTRPQRRIGVHYYRPDTFTPASPILIVLPGAGRDGDEYRDAWIEAAERSGALVAALEYPAADYDFAAYHMAGLVRDLSFPPGAAASDVVRLRDEDIVFTPNPRPEEWLFGDFDRIFDLLRTATGSVQTGYDLFGHSAGAQILHRMALAWPDSRARRIVAANAGFYTLPDLDAPLLFGLGGSGVDAATLRRGFSSRLILLLGALDDSDEAGGVHLHTPQADQQGRGRLSRGRYFHRFAERQAAAMQAPLAWRLEVVPDVAHDFRAMSRAAARLLYDTP